MKKNWHKADIKSAIEKTGETLSSLSKKSGYACSTVRVSLSHPGPAGNHVIANHLGLSVHDIWPEWYASDGSRIFNNRYKKYTRRTPWRLRQKEGVQ